MKKDRNYGMPPYPMYQGNPMMGHPIPNVMPEQPGFQQPGMGITNQEINKINRRLDNIERRLTTLESTSGTKRPTTHDSNFTDSNYQMI